MCVRAHHARLDMRFPACRAQAYVGAFLKRPEQAATTAAVMSAVDKAAAGGAAEGGSKPDSANHLYEVGTFAQVGGMGVNKESALGWRFRTVVVTVHTWSRSHRC